MKFSALSYKGKLLAYFSALFAVFTLLLVLFQQNREHQYRHQLLEARLRSYADMAATVLPKGDRVAMTAELQHLEQTFPAELRLTVVCPDGAVFFESGSPGLSGMDNHHSRPEVEKALQHTESSYIRHSATRDVDYFYFAKSYDKWVVRLALPYDSEVKNFMKADNIFLWFVVMLFPVILVVLIHIADRFGKSVSGLRHFIDSAERGLVDYDHISLPHSELGDIGTAIVQKYKQLEDSNKQTAQERERLIRHFHHFEEGIAFFSAERKAIYVNPRFLQYMNMVLDKPSSDTSALWAHEAFEQARNFLEQHEDKGKAMKETPILRYTIRPNHSHAYLALQLLVYGDGTFEMTLSDITAVEKNRLLKQQISSNITHELRTPVSSIRGYMETILANPEMDAERRCSFVEKAHAQAVRLSDLIRDVSLINKVEEAPEALPKEEVGLRQMVEDVVEEFQMVVAEKKMTVENCIAAHLKVVGNYALLHSVFRNLIENSLRYAGEAARIKVECYNEDAAFCYFRYYDTGGGVGEEHLPRLFERFYRVGEGRTRDGGGTGLGLSIVRNAVLFHQGTISVRNRKTGGLEFLFTLKKNA